MIPIEDVAEVVDRYLARFPEEHDRLAPLVGALGSGSAITDRANRSGHLTCSALLIDPNDRVLHIRHNLLGIWLRPGGHVEPHDTSLLQAALRELYEEAGIPASVVSPVETTPLDIDVHTIPANPARGEPEHWHFDLCYAFRVADRPEVALQAEEVSGYQWIPASDLQPVAFRRKVMPFVVTGRHPGE
jgi:8-oxo-dGTP pyrophosphatase MutT (NUDIX family)